MHPMTLQETGESTGSVSLAELFEGDFTPSQCPNGLQSLSDVACRGGWPGIASALPEDAQVVVGEYMESVFEQSVPTLGGSGAIARRLCASIARSLGQSARNTVLARDVYGLEDGAPSDADQRAVAAHLDYLARLYLVDEVPGWVPAARSPKRMRIKPKRYFADPSIAVALLGLGSASLLQDWQTFGLVFENMCMRDLDVYARALPDCAGHPVKYYRDDSDLEVDAIIDRADGRWGAFEIKLSQDKVDEAAATLLRLERKLCSDERSRTSAPSFLAVLTGMGEAAYRRPDGVYVIPVRALGV